MMLLAMVSVAHPVLAQEEVGVAEAVRGDTASSGFVAKALHWYDAHMNYWAVGGLMAIESSFVPFPSEVVIPPAVYVAANPEGKSGMKIWLVVLFGTLDAPSSMLLWTVSGAICYVFREKKWSGRRNISMITV